jgi:diacylglycerol kinase (ATP)
MAKVTLTEELPVQVDGEAWLQKPGNIVVSHKNKARMLVKDKAFTQTFESWNKKHGPNQPAHPTPVTSTLQQSLSQEELSRYRELAASIPPLVA